MVVRDSSEFFCFLVLGLAIYAVVNAVKSRRRKLVNLPVRGWRGSSNARDMMKDEKEAGLEAAGTRDHRAKRRLW